MNPQQQQQQQQKPAARFRIAKLEEIAKEQKARAEAARDLLPTMPLKVRIVPVNFARANDVSARVKEILSERGTISTDERTNVLIVKDIEDNVIRAEQLVRQSMRRTPRTAFKLSDDAFAVMTGLELGAAHA